MSLPLPTLLYLQLFTIITCLIDDQPYCALRYRRLCQGKGSHVGCQFPEPGPSEYCINYTKIKFTGGVQKFITNYINRRRQRIASGSEKVRGGVLLPKPGIMMLVEWDRELAFLAQRFADQCHFAHDECRATVRYPYAGQTVGEVRLRRSSESDQLTAQRAIRRVFDAWWGEKRRVLPSQLMTPFRLIPKGTVWGHFSQLAVWTLRAVGCGAVLHGEGYPHLLLVCDFSHTNMLGQRTLSPGPIAPCPLHTVRKPRTAYPLLCAAVPRPVSPNMELQENWEVRLIEGQTLEHDEDEHTILNSDNMIRTYGIELKGSSKTSLKKLHSKSTNAKTTIDNFNIQSTTEVSVYSRGRKKEEENDIEQKSRWVKMDQNNRLYNENSHLASQTRTRITKNYLKSTVINRRDRKKDKEDNVEQKSQFDSVQQNSRLDNGEQNHHFDNDSERKIVEGSHSSWYSIRPQLAMQQLEEVTPALGNIHPLDVNTPTFRGTLTMSGLPINTEMLYESTSVLHDPLFRHRWKYTKDRPRRPGANALLNNPTGIIQTASRRPSIASLLLDKEDVDQFIRDTGFNPQWRPHPK